MFAFFSAMAQGGQQTLQTTPTITMPASVDSEMVALTNKVESLKIQQQIDALATQKTVLEKQQRASPAPTTTDEQMTAAKNQMAILLIARQIEGLKVQQAALLNPPPTPVIPVAPVHCLPSQGPRVTVHAPPKAVNWACQHLGVCTDNKPVEVPTSGACPAGMTPAAAPNQK